jgi:hypothetical protein
MEDNGDKGQPQAGWVFQPGGASAAPVHSAPVSSVPAPSAPAPAANARVAWSASEYIANPKNASWFMLLGIVSLVLSVVIYLLTKDFVSTGVIAVLGIVVGVFAARQPHVLEYQLDQSGIHIAEKFYPYGSFKSFSVVEEGAFGYISLLPLKRFMPPLAIHYSPDDEKQIVETLADYLPFEEHKRDLVESFSRRVRF